MALIDEIKAETDAGKITVCTVGRWYLTLTKKERLEVDEVLKSDYPAYTICRVLQRHYPNRFGERTFVRHMRKECCCVAER